MNSCHICTSNIEIVFSQLLLASYTFCFAAFVGSTAAIRLSIPSLERFGGVVTAEQVTNFTNMLVSCLASGWPCPKGW